MPISQTKIKNKFLYLTSIMHKKKLYLVVEQRGAYEKLLFFSRYERSRNKNSRLLLYKSLKIMITLFL